MVSSADCRNPLKSVAPNAVNRSLVKLYIRHWNTGLSRIEEYFFNHHSATPFFNYEFEKESGDVTISLTKRWVCQQLRKRPPMIRQACCHSRGSGSKDPILTAAKRFVGPDQIIAGHADGKLGL